MSLLLKQLLGKRSHFFVTKSLPSYSHQHYLRCLSASCSRFQEAAQATTSEDSGSGSGSSGRSPGFLREAYHCNQEWNSRLESPLIKKINLDEFFYDIDKRYQTDKVISAIDVDLFTNKVTEEDNLDEMEELVHRLRTSPATADALASTSYAVIKALLNAKKYDDLMRILNDRWNYGVFLDHHSANILMDEFLKQGNNRDAAKIASLLMLEEDFGTPISRNFALVSCLKYLSDPSPEPWDTTPPKPEPEEETKVRLYYIRNAFFDDHFDLVDPNHVIGKTLALVSEEISEDKVLAASVRLLGLAMYGKWDKLETLLLELVKQKIPVAQESIIKATELCDKALADIEASPTKTLPKPKVHQYPGVNLDEKDLNKLWTQLNYPEYEKFVPKVKSLLTGNQLTMKKDFNLLQKAQDLLSSALSEREDTEIQDQLKVFEHWNERRVEELDKQILRFKRFEVSENAVEKKKELQEKEEVVFFFDNEEEWMMRLPPDEQQGYKLSTDYIPANWTPYVRAVPPKKIRRRKNKA